MDTSKKYIEMCSKATEIQELRYSHRDWEYQDFGVKIDNECYDEEADASNFELLHFNTKQKGVIWLPRQDQLQEMITIKLWRLVRKISDFHVKNYAFLSEATMEQLWLAFVMKEKYQKIWNEGKKDWENE